MSQPALSLCLNGYRTKRRKRVRELVGHISFHALLPTNKFNASTKTKVLSYCLHYRGKSEKYILGAKAKVKYNSTGAIRWVQTVSVLLNKRLFSQYDLLPLFWSCFSETVHLSLYDWSLKSITAIACKIVTRIIIRIFLSVSQRKKERHTGLRRLK